MESSPLTLAYNHARAASIATQTSDTTVAINEHTLAAGEFARAADQTGSQEALRTLKLLESHHQRLSELLKFPSENPVTTTTIADADIVSETEKNVSTSAAVSELRSPKNEALKPSPSRRSPASTSNIHVPRRMPQRELSSSIASNLASARGIRSSNDRRALSPSVTALQAPGSLESPRKPSRLSNQNTLDRVSSKPSWVPPVGAAQGAQVSVSRATVPAETTTLPAADEGFSRFYNTFESLLSKLSAPLAFAGLPLITEEPSSTTSSTTIPTPAPAPRPLSRRTSVSPDLTKLISRAALRASASTNPVNDSFYVVPTTGHTVSYANILSFDQKEKRRLAASMHGENPELFDDPDGDEDFVDAREHPMPPSPTLSRGNSKVSAGGGKKGVGAKGATGKDVEIVMEELYIENKSLKDIVDKLSKRLQAFEMSAQSSSLALQESMRMMRPNSPALLPVGAMAPNVGTVASFGQEQSRELVAKVKNLEDAVNARDKEMERVARDNEKLKGILARYRDKWEKLKEGARTRMADGGRGDGNGNGGGESSAKGEGKGDADGNGNGEAKDVKKDTRWIAG